MMDFEPVEIPYTLPLFPLELHSIRDYQKLLNNCTFILHDRLSRIELLLEDDGLIEGVEEDLRSARGKIIVLTKKNLSTFDRLLREARNDKQGVLDLTGFWSIIVPELIDVQKACERVQRHYRNRGRLSISSSPRSFHKSSPKSQIPAPNPQIKRTSLSRSTPGLRKFLASKRREILNEYN